MFSVQLQRSKPHHYENVDPVMQSMVSAVLSYVQEIFKFESFGITTKTKPCKLSTLSLYKKQH